MMTEYILIKRNLEEIGNPGIIEHHIEEEGKILKVLDKGSSSTWGTSYKCKGHSPYRTITFYENEVVLLSELEVKMRRFLEERD